MSVSHVSHQMAYSTSDSNGNNSDLGGGIGDGWVDASGGWGMSSSGRQDPFAIERVWHVLSECHTSLKEHFLKLGCHLKSGLVARAGLEFSIALRLILKIF